MSATNDVPGNWPALVFILPMALAGLGMMARPALFARWQADSWRENLGIVAGPVGPGSRLYYRIFGLGLVGLAFFLIWNEFVR